MTRPRFKDLSPAAKAFLEALPPIHGIEPPKPASAYLPTRNGLRADIQSGDVGARSLIRTMIDPIFERWTTLLAQGLAGLERIEQHAASMSTSPIRPVPGLPVKYGDLPFKLRLNIKMDARGGKVAARELVEASGASLTRLIGRVTNTSAHAADAVIALRKFDDVIIRVLAAREASARTGRPVAEVLALHREEGNLCVFPSNESIEIGVPSAAPSESETGREETIINIGDRPTSRISSGWPNPQEPPSTRAMRPSSDTPSRRRSSSSRSAATSSAGSSGRGRPRSSTSSKGGRRKTGSEEAPQTART